MSARDDADRQAGRRERLAREGLTVARLEIPVERQPFMERLARVLRSMHRSGELAGVPLELPPDLIDAVRGTASLVGEMSAALVAVEARLARIEEMLSRLSAEEGRTK